MPLGRNTQDIRISELEKRFNILNEKIKKFCRKEGLKHTPWYTHLKEVQTLPSILSPIPKDKFSSFFKRKKFHKKTDGEYKLYQSDQVRGAISVLIVAHKVQKEPGKFHYLLLALGQLIDTLPRELGVNIDDTIADIRDLISLYVQQLSYISYLQKIDDKHSLIAFGLICLSDGCTTSSMERYLNVVWDRPHQEKAFLDANATIIPPFHHIVDHDDQGRAFLRVGTSSVLVAYQEQEVQHEDAEEGFPDLPPIIPSLYAYPPSPDNPFTYLEASATVIPSFHHMADHAAQGSALQRLDIASPPGAYVQYYDAAECDDDVAKEFPGLPPITPSLCAYPLSPHTPFA